MPQQPADLRRPPLPTPAPPPRSTAPGRSHRPRQGANTNESPYHTVGQPSFTSTRGDAGGGPASAPNAWHTAGSWREAHQPAAPSRAPPAPAAAAAAPTASPTAGGLWKHKANQPCPMFSFRQQNPNVTPQPREQKCTCSQQKLPVHNLRVGTGRGCSLPRPSRSLCIARTPQQRRALSCSEGLLQSNSLRGENKLIYLPRRKR